MRARNELSEKMLLINNLRNENNTQKIKRSRIKYGKKQRFFYSQYNRRC